jgi:elongation of very long chain fatty acids protein 7
MQNRKPFNVGKLQMCHNIFHLSTNLYFLYMATAGIERSWAGGINFFCEPYDTLSTKRSLDIARMCWLFYMSKYTDCFETVLFVLRKRSHMVNYYHVFHHSMMPATIWVTVKFFPSGHATFFGFINPIVHIVYYSYYMTKQFYPRIKETFWWFRTFSIIFQVGQFVLLIVHAMQLVFRNKCGYPMGYSYFVMSITTLFYLIFMYQYKWRKCANQSNLLR